MSDSSTVICRRAIFHGRVQGVGFRWTTSRIAKPIAVAGWVRNRPDGTVELIVQGPADVVEMFLNEVQAQMASGIDHVETSEESVQADLSGFSIRR